MKVCLRSNKYAAEADELHIDKLSQLDFLYKKFPDKTYIYTIKNAEIDWNEIRHYQALTKDHLILELRAVDDMIRAKEYGIPFFFGYPINTYYELNSLIKMGVCYIKVGPPIFFDLKNLRAVSSVPLRCSPNIRYMDGLPRENGIFGQWIRPEDLYLYEPYITTIEFEDINDLRREEALYRIYFKDKHWHGNMNEIFTNMNVDLNNGYLGSKLAERRINCGQRCQSGGSCRLCERMITLAAEEIKRGKKENGEG